MQPSRSHFLGALLSLAAAAGASLLLCACGSGTSSATAGPGKAVSSPATEGKASGARLTSTQTPSKAQALAFADTVNLSVSDIPEASVAHRSGFRSSAQERREFRACERGIRGITHERPLLERSSPKLKRGQELEVEDFSSSVSVVRDERYMAPAFRAVQSASVRACLARAFTRNFSERPIREAHWGQFTVSKLAISAPGATDTFGIRVSGALNIPYSEVSVPVYVDMMGFAVGHGVVSLMAGSPTQPVPTATEQELVSLLLARVKAHSL